MKKTLIKIISIVLVLCTLITICILPASASESSHRYFSEAFPLDLVSIRLKGSSDYIDTKLSKGNGTYETDGDVVFVKYQNFLLAKGIDLIMFQSKKQLLHLDKGDKVTFNLSLLAPFCDKMALILYKSDGNYLTAPLYFNRSSAIHTSNDVVRRLSGEPLVYGEQELVYCHEYTLNYQYISGMGDDIYAIQIQAKFNDESQVRKFWLCYEECNFTVDKPDESTDTGTFNVFTSIWNGIKNIFNSITNFGLEIGNKMKSAFTPFFNNIMNGLNAVISPIKNIPTTISDFFQKTFLGKVLQITNKTKTFVNNSGTGVQYAAVNDEAGDSSDNSQDWDMIYSPNYFIDVEYYSNLIPNVFEPEG